LAQPGEQDEKKMAAETERARGTGYTVPNPNGIKRPECLSWTVLPVPVYHSLV
jgi:hypothetical protein